MVALAPSAVAPEVVGQGQRIAFIAPAFLRQKTHLVAGAIHKHRLDLIVADDMAAQRRAAREHGQPAVLSERGEADDGVVAPELTAIALPPAGAEHEDAHAKAMAELKNPGKERRARQADGKALQDADPRVALHDSHEPNNSFTAHQTVSVEQDHKFIVVAISFTELMHVAALESDIAAAPPIG